MNKLDKFSEFLVENILKQANEAIQEYQNNKTDVFLQGKNLAYYEVAALIRDAMQWADIDEKRYGLNQDIDTMFFGQKTK